MSEPIHGGDVWRWGAARPLDFSASLNPMGMAPEVRQAAHRGVELSVHYPDPLCAGLSRALSAQTGLPEDWMVWGNGAAALLEAAVGTLRPRRALLFSPCFGEYERVLTQFHCEIHHHPLRPEDSFDLTGAALSAIVPGLDLVLLCTPNNPTGRCIDPALLSAALERCEQVGAAALVDESFLELSDPERRTNLLPRLRPGCKLLLLRSLTKSHCIPGLRLGCALCADEAWMSAIRGWGQPWSVSVPAQLAGEAALGRPDWPEAALRLIRPERVRMTKALRELGCTVWESDTNFLLFRAPGDRTLRERLLGRGILIRSCAGFRGLGPDYYRAAIRTGEENTTLLAAVREERGTWHDPL